MDFKLTRTDRFPVGTSVAAYPASARREGAAPFGSAVDTQTMAADGLTFTGLQPQTAYVAYAQVNGEHRYISFLTPAEPPPQGGGDFNPPWTEIELDPQLFTAYFPGYMYPAWRWIEPLGVVEVRGGLIAVNNLSGNDLIVQLPTQYAPPLSIDFVVTSITGTVNQITIDSSGALFFVNPQQQGEVWHLGSWIRWNVPAS